MYPTYHDVKRSATDYLLKIGFGTSVHLKAVADVIVRSLEAGFPIMDEQVDTVISRHPGIDSQAVKEAIVRNGFFSECTSCKYGDYALCAYYQRDLRKYCLTSLDDLVSKIKKAGMKTGADELKTKLSTVRYHQKAWQVLPDGIVPTTASILEGEQSVSFEGDYEKMQHYKDLILADLKNNIKVRSAYGMWLTLEPTNSILEAKIEKNKVDARVILLKKPCFGSAKELYELCFNKLKKAGWKIRSRESEGMYVFNMTIVDGKHAIFFSRDNRTQELRGVGYTSESSIVKIIEADFDRLWRGPASVLTIVKYEIKRLIGPPIHFLIKLFSTILGIVVGLLIGGPFSAIIGGVTGLIGGHLLVAVALTIKKILEERTVE